MKKVFRHEDNQRYWDRRWSEAGQDPNQFADLNIYPIRYAEMVMQDPNARTLELGAGLGRVLKHYHYAGYRIEGVERSDVAVHQLTREDASLKIRVADACQLPYADASFDNLLAFGVYHNIEQNLHQALEETARCLKPGGQFCISMRPNNLEMRLNEVYWNWRRRPARHGARSFHKWLVGEKEFQVLLRSFGLETRQVFRARNMSIFYRIPWFRSSAGDESTRRGGGYRLNAPGRLLDRLVTGTLPGQFCNVLVFVGNKLDAAPMRRSA